MRLTILATSFALVLSACAMTPEADTPPPASVAAVPTPAVSMPVAPEETAPAVERPLVVTPAPERKPVTAKPKSTAASESADSKRSAVRTTTAGSPTVAVAPGAKPVPGPETGIMRISMTTNNTPPVVARAPLQGPSWLKSCKNRQDQGDVIMCDADTLLAYPGEKVLVYSRDARKVGKLPNGGKVVLRESLPNVYRFFVLQ
ncbi:hypothetical protein [Viridibacterium curvum]|uniref:Uncharacterized protein n=1 Tax=Viridibacterium curvum TaxID=1101404 RepID=A0ABP9QUC4_9RHOO